MANNTDYNTPGRNAQTAMDRPMTGDRNQVDTARKNNTVVWLIVGLLALAGIAFAMGAFDNTAGDEYSSASGSTMTEASSDGSASTDSTVGSGTTNAMTPATETPVTPTDDAAMTDGTTATGTDSIE